MEYLLTDIVQNDDLHARFLNSLSLMEHSGACKISSSQRAPKINTMILKHAAEEHRHAYYLKKQLEKLSNNYPDYADSSLLAAQKSRFYLHRLDKQTALYIRKTLQLTGEELHFAAYLLVTYAIEVRADALYAPYQKVLSQLKSKVNVKAIILEEEGHLTEMKAQLEAFDSNWETHAKEIIILENTLFNEWKEALKIEIVDEAKHACCF